MLKSRKGFSLIELLVVIAIIGVLSAVGITAYSGYTKDAKKKVTLAQHQQVVAFLNAESAKCAGGEGNFGFQGTTIACTSAWTASAITTHINSDTSPGMGMDNPYKTGTNFAVTTAAEGATVITISSGSAVVTTTTVSGTTKANTIARY